MIDEKLNQEIKDIKDVINRYKLLLKDKEDADKTIKEIKKDADEMDGERSKLVQLIKELKGVIEKLTSDGVEKTELIKIMKDKLDDYEDEKLLEEKRLEDEKLMEIAKPEGLTKERYMGGLTFIVKNPIKCPKCGKTDIATKEDEDTKTYNVDDEEQQNPFYTGVKFICNKCKHTWKMDHAQPYFREQALKGIEISLWNGPE